MNKKAQAYSISERRHLVMFVLFGLGATFAVTDPFHSIPSEGNWIRYWTAGVLVTGGITAIWSSLNRAYLALDRLCGAAFGLLLVAAAGDELFEFHERNAESVGALMAPGSVVNSQDMSTPGIGIIGFVGLAAGSRRTFRFLSGKALRHLT